MEKYVVIYKTFIDLEDNNYLYKKGDIYPREGFEPTKKRINELSSKKNKIGEVLIKKVEEQKEEKIEKTEEEQNENKEVEESKDDAEEKE